MDSYSEFSKWYDELMEDVPYDEWFEFVKGKLSDNNIKNSLIAELGAGTGNFTMRLAKAGYDMIGIDNSEDMLSIAREKKDDHLTRNVEEKDKNDKVSEIMYICQDMRDFELYGTVSAIISVCDSINYILEDEELIHTFELVNNYLDPEGLFIFDFNTDHKYREVIGDSIIADNNEDVAFIWSNFYDGESFINEYDVTFFVKEKNNDDLYRKFEEYHYQRGYTLEEIKEFINKAGLIFVEAYDADGFKEVSDHSERIFVIAKEKGKI